MTDCLSQAAKIYMATNVWSHLMNKIPIRSVTKHSLKDVCLAIHLSFNRSGREGKWKGRRFPLPLSVVFIGGECLLGLGRDVSSTSWTEQPLLPAHVASLPSFGIAARSVPSIVWRENQHKSFGNDYIIPHHQLYRNRKINMSALNNLLWFIHLIQQLQTCKIVFLVYY